VNDDPTWNSNKLGLYYIKYRVSYTRVFFHEQTFHIAKRDRLVKPLSPGEATGPQAAELQWQLVPFDCHTLSTKA
jgi:hypothetical protein